MLTDSDLAILRLVARMYYLTAEQVRQRYYGNSLSWVQARLKSLVELGYLTRRGFMPKLDGGSYPYIYSLSGKGRKLLVELEYLPRQRYRASEDRNLRQYPTHTLAINDVLIALEKTERLAYFVHERDIARMRIPYKPDGYLHLTDERGYLLEVDMKTESPKVWQDKMERLARFVNSDAYDAFFPKFRGVVVVSKDDRRLLALQSWTEFAFARMGLPGATSAFIYTTLDVARDTDQLATLL